MSEHTDARWSTCRQGRTVSEMVRRNVLGLWSKECDKGTPLTSAQLRLLGVSSSKRLLHLVKRQPRQCSSKKMALDDNYLSVLGNLMTSVLERMTCSEDDEDFPYILSMKASGSLGLRGYLLACSARLSLTVSFQPISLATPLTTVRSCVVCVFLLLLLLLCLTKWGREEVRTCLALLQSRIVNHGGRGITRANDRDSAAGRRRGLLTY